MVRVGAGIGVTGGSVAATIVTVVTAAAARLRVVIIVAARAAGATRRTFVGVTIVITSVSGIVRIHSGGQYRFLEEQGRHRLAAAHGLVARGQGFDRIEQALIRGVLVRIRNCTARAGANRPILVIIIHIHRCTARAAANRAVLVVIVIVHNRTATGTWGVIVIEIIDTDSAARTTRTIILAIRVDHCGSGAARTATGWAFGGILGIAGFIGIAGIGRSAGIGKRGGFEQRGAFLHLQFHRSAGSTGAANHATAAATTANRFGGLGGGGRRSVHGCSRIGIGYG